MAGLSELVEAATEGMRKTQSADPIEENSNQPPPPTKDDGHLSDSAVAPTRERKKGELFFPAILPRFVRFLPNPPLRIWSARDSASDERAVTRGAERVLIHMFLSLRFPQAFPGLRTSTASSSSAFRSSAR